MERDAPSRWGQLPGRCCQRTSVRAHEDELGCRRIVGHNQTREREDTVWKGPPKGFGVLTYLFVSTERDAPGNDKLSVRLLVGEHAVYVSRVERLDVAVKELLDACCVLLCHSDLLISSICFQPERRPIDVPFVGGRS